MDASPQHLANSLINNVFYGPHLTKSANNCLLQIQHALKPFGYDVEVMKARVNDGRHTQNRPTRFSTSNEQKLYCGRCSVHSQSDLHDDAQFHCCVIGYFKLEQVSEEEAAKLGIPTNYSRVTLTQLYPHPVECKTTTPCRLHKNMMSLSHLGSGYTIIDVDYGAVIGDMFDSIIQKLGKLSKSKIKKLNNKHGKIILSSGQEYQSPDLRGLIMLDDIVDPDPTQVNINENYGLTDTSFQNKLATLTTRLTILLSNTLHIADEFKTIACYNCPENVPAPPAAEIDRQHLYLKKPSIIFAGYKMGNVNAPHQCPHIDFGKSNDGYYIEDNNRLKNKCKPMTLVVPLSTERKLIIYREQDGLKQQRIITVEKGKALLFEGNVVHSGWTYVENAGKGPIPDLFPALHFYLYSNEHRCNLNDFVVSSHHILTWSENKVFIPMVEDECKEEEFVNGVEKIIEMLENYNIQGDLLDDHVVNLADYLLTKHNQRSRVPPPSRRSSRDNDNNNNSNDDMSCTSDNMSQDY